MPPIGGGASRCFRGGFADTETVVMSSKTGTVRRIKNNVRNIGARFIG